MIIKKRQNYFHHRMEENGKFRYKHKHVCSAYFEKKKRQLTGTRTTE